MPAAVLAVTLLGCSLGQAQPSCPVTETDSTETEHIGTPYGFDLPKGDPSPEGNEPIVYGRLMVGDCAGAQDSLDGGWEEFGNPRNVLLFQAAIEACAGYVEEAKRWFGRAADEYGWEGLTLRWHTCEVFRATASFVLQQPKDQIVCEGDGRHTPTWPSGGDRVDPRQQAGEPSASASPSPVATSTATP